MAAAVWMTAAHSSTVDRFENDEDPDYPYERDR